MAYQEKWGYLAYPGGSSSDMYSHSVFHSKDGKQWVPTAGWNRIDASYLFAADYTFLFSTFGGTVFASTDGGSSWTPTNGGPGTQTVPQKPSFLSLNNVRYLVFPVGAKAVGSTNYFNYTVLFGSLSLCFFLHRHPLADVYPTRYRSISGDASPIRKSEKPTSHYWIK